MLKLTLLTSAVASATFIGTLAFAPAVIEVGERLGFVQSESPQVIAPAVVVNLECKTVFKKVVAALKNTDCSP